MFLGFDTSQIIVLLTLAGGLFAQYLSYSQHRRNSLKEDYDRQHAELNEERARAEGLEKQSEEWRMKYILAEGRRIEAEMQVASLTKEIQSMKENKA